MKNAQREHALHRIELILKQKNEHIPFPILDYLKAEILLQKGNYSGAISWFQHFIKTQNNQKFIKDSYYKIAVCQYLMNDVVSSDRSMELGRANGTDYTEADRYAKIQLNNQPLPNPVLLKLRYAIDGGYYSAAKVMIEKTKERIFNTDKEKAENSNIWILKKNKMLE